MQGTEDPIWNNRHEIEEFADTDALVFTLWNKGVGYGQKDSQFGNVVLRSDQLLPNGFEGDLVLTGGRQTSNLARSTLRVKVEFRQGEDISVRRVGAERVLDEKSKGKASPYCKVGLHDVYVDKTGGGQALIQPTPLQVQ